jgi:hypothetical protein
MVDTKNQFFIFVMIFIAIIVGITLFIESANTADALTETQPIINDSITWPLNGSDVNVSYDGITSFTRIINSSSNVLDTSNYSVNTTTGTITALDNTTICTTGDTCLADYIYQDDNYIDDSSSRAVTRLIIIMFAVGLIAVALIIVTKMGLFNEMFK